MDGRASEGYRPQRISRSVKGTLRDHKTLHRIFVLTYISILLKEMEAMNYEDIKLTSAEIGTLWSEYINGTMTDCVNRYMVTIIEHEAIKKVFEDAINIFAKQKQEIAQRIAKDGFPVPLGFTDSDINTKAPRLFTDIFCLQYLHVMTLITMES